MNPIESLFVEELGYDHYGLKVVKVDGDEYAVADSDEQAEEAALEAARSSLWAFNTSFLAGHLDLSETQQKAIQKMQEELCENAQEVILLMLGDKVDAVLAEAIAADGRGHFLSPYDGDEWPGEDIHAALTGRICYRV